MVNFGLPGTCVQEFMYMCAIHASSCSTRGEIQERGLGPTESQMSSLYVNSI